MSDLFSGLHVLQLLSTCSKMKDSVIMVSPVVHEFIIVSYDLQFNNPHLIMTFRYNYSLCAVKFSGFCYNCSF